MASYLPFFDTRKRLALQTLYGQAPAQASAQGTRMRVQVAQGVPVDGRVSSDIPGLHPGSQGAPAPSQQEPQLWDNSTGVRGSLERPV